MKFLNPTKSFLKYKIIVRKYQLWRKNKLFINNNFCTFIINYFYIFFKLCFLQLQIYIILSIKIFYFLHFYHGFWSFVVLNFNFHLYLVICRYSWKKIGTNILPTQKRLSYPRHQLFYTHILPSRRRPSGTIINYQGRA